MQVVQTEFVQSAPSRTPEPPIRALARQLQLRLRYARLKVEHGWQRQTINEVENLYFHHHHHHHLHSTPLKAAEALSQSSSATAHPDGPASSGKSQVGTADANSDVVTPINSEVPGAAAHDLPRQQKQTHFEPVMELGIHETGPGSGVVLPARGCSASSESSLPGQIDEDRSDPTTTTTTDDNSQQNECRGRNGSFAQNAPPAAPAAGTALGLAPAPAPAPAPAANASGSASSNAQIRQLAVAQPTNTNTTGSGRPAVLTYDSFWSSHSLGSATYNYSPYSDSAG